ncbi:MAG: molybdopterin-binding protein [Spirochaetaceae bacterium]|jgi:hypothetical protein|nr:molybdopterin-binding protein [Spirochaetaceae bacterium]
MKQVRIEDAVGTILCHDLTRIVPGEMKGARFRKGHIIGAEDIPVLRSMGKNHLYVWEQEAGMVHENEAALRLADLCGKTGFKRSNLSEGKVELFAEYDGLFRIDLERFTAVNQVPEVIIAARHSLSAVKAGDKLAGMRVIPLVIPEERLREAETAAGDAPLFDLLPYTLKTAGAVITGSEIAEGRIPDAFTPYLTEKLGAYGIRVVKALTAGDGIASITEAIAEVRRDKPDMVVCTGGMSVDPDDNTPGAIKQSGADIAAYGVPVLPGSMFLLGYYADGTPVMGLPGGVMYHKNRGSIFDIVLPRIAAGLRITRRDLVLLGNGGLCLACPECHYPVCPFGKAG